MKIVTHHNPKPIPLTDHDWEAIDDDSYDGAPDAGPRCRCIGYGSTEDEAIADLKSQLEEFGHGHD